MIDVSNAGAFLLVQDLQNIIDKLDFIADEANFSFLEDKLMVYEDTEDLTVYLEISPSWFIDYIYKRPVTLTLNLSEIAGILTNLSPFDLVGIVINSEAWLVIVRENDIIPKSIMYKKSSMTRIIPLFTHDLVIGVQAAKFKYFFMNHVTGKTMVVKYDGKSVKIDGKELPGVVEIIAKRTYEGIHRVEPFKHILYHTSLSPGIVISFGKFDSSILISESQKIMGELIKFNVIYHIRP